MTTIQLVQILRKTVSPNKNALLTAKKLFEIDGPQNIGMLAILQLPRLLWILFGNLFISVKYLLYDVSEHNCLLRRGTG